VQVEVEAVGLGEPEQLVEPRLEAVRRRCAERAGQPGHAAQRATGIGHLVRQRLAGVAVIGFRREYRDRLWREPAGPFVT